MVCTPRKIALKVSRHARIEQVCFDAYMQACLHRTWGGCAMGTLDRRVASGVSRAGLG